MKNQILSLAFFMLTTTLMVVQGETKKSETIDQTNVSDITNIAKVDVNHQNGLKTIY